jgi:calcineurin-like phosphoesterase family protein
MKFFTADPHLGHGKVMVGPRGNNFSDIEEWNNHFIGQCKRLVKSSDELFIIGDLSMERPELWRKYLPKQTWLIHGNHDGSDAKCRHAFGNRFRYVMMTKIGDAKHECWLSHYPHAFWPGSHKGSYHLFGHVHDQRSDTLDEWMPQRRSMDVCPEAVFRLLGEFRPINEHEVLEVLKDREGHDQVDFYKKLRGSFSFRLPCG